MTAVGPGRARIHAKLLGHLLPTVVGHFYEYYEIIALKIYIYKCMGSHARRLDDETLGARRMSSFAAFIEVHELKLPHSILFLQSVQQR